MPDANVTMEEDRSRRADRLGFVSELKDVNGNGKKNPFPMMLTPVPGSLK
jgi:hypothetical protein